jgi:hypothetical protein
MTALARSALLSVLLVSISAQDAPPPPPADYVVHEWGTFTSMVGTAGIVLEGLHHEEEALPPFVHELRSIASFDTTHTKLPASRVTQKMETPVIYFHSEQARTVSVQVWFVHGLMTQFFPLPNEVYPPLGEALKHRIDMSKIDGSYLRWNIDVLARGAVPQPAVPTTADDDPWTFARQTTANHVRTRPDADSPAQPETEHYLFYRGLGRWQPEVGITSQGAGKAIFRNDLAGRIPFCLLLEIEADGGRFAIGGAVEPGHTTAFDLGRTPWQRDREMLARQIGAAVLQALVAEGLYLDEARAMVATWSRSWFRRDGARVLWLLPRAQVDAVLPLHLDPTPRELVRTLVGRLEFITPEAQRRVEQAIADLAAKDAERRRRGAAGLLALDRFLEPHLRNIAANGSSSQLRDAATARLAQLRD